MALKTEKEIFESCKGTFQDLYGQPWNKDIHLFTEYLQTVYLRAIHGMIEGGVNGIHRQQIANDMTLSGIKGSLDELKKK
jgi:hypothetical protein